MAPVLGKDTTLFHVLCFISCGMTVQVPTLDLDGWTKDCLALEIPWGVLLRVGAVVGAGSRK